MVGVKDGKLYCEFENTPRKSFLLWRRKVLYLVLCWFYYRWKLVNRSLYRHYQIKPVEDWVWKGDRIIKDDNNDGD